MDLHHRERILTAVPEHLLPLLCTLFRGEFLPLMRLVEEPCWFWRRTQSFSSRRFENRAAFSSLVPDGTPGHPGERDTGKNVSVFRTPGPAQGSGLTPPPLLPAGPAGAAHGFSMPRTRQGPGRAQSPGQPRQAPHCTAFS